MSKKVIKDPTGIVKPLKNYARTMKKNPTPSEAEFWKLVTVKLKGVIGKRVVKRQVIFGWYILDFVVTNRCLVIELDGSAHTGREAYDQRRDQYISRFGLTVLRFQNSQVWNEPEEILKQIRAFPIKYGFKGAQVKANHQRIAAQEKKLNSMGLSMDRIERKVVPMPGVEARPVQIKKGRILTGLASKIRPKCPNCARSVAHTWNVCEGCNSPIEWILRELPSTNQRYTE